MTTTKKTTAKLKLKSKADKRGTEWNSYADASLEAGIRVYASLEFLADAFRSMHDLTTRDLFALMALAGDGINRSPQDCALHCYLVADAMLKERAKVKAEAAGPML